MNICVLGLGHLGAVTAACLAKLGHRVIAVDFDEANVTELRAGNAPLTEAGLNELLNEGISSGRLRFATHPAEVVDVEVVWAAFDTPIDDDDVADAGSVLRQIERLIRGTTGGFDLLISSQLPVGSVRLLERFITQNCPEREIAVSCSPENLRLGSAVRDFMQPNRIIVGVRPGPPRVNLQRLLETITPSIEWMPVESAEMTKHAINAFFAASIAFANEIAVLCEAVGADAREVERGLKSEARIGPRAYLSPGAAFGGGTLARDVAYLVDEARRRGVNARLLTSVLPSNEEHGRWAQHKLESLFVDLSQKAVAVWGLTYKPNTGSLRRSAAVALCEWLIRQGVELRVHDPMAGALPEHWHGVRRCADPLTAIVDADVLIVGTAWPTYACIRAADIVGRAPGLTVLDAHRALNWPGTGESAARYFSVGMRGIDS